MCLGVPGKVTELFDEDGVRMGTVDFGGITRKVCLEYAPEVEVGSFVVIHVGFAISVVDEEEAARSYAPQGGLSSRPARWRIRRTASPVSTRPSP
jgi:hydrogenase expression/formation protein HypC